MVSMRCAEDREKSLLRQLFGLRWLGNPAPEETEQRLPVPDEEVVESSLPAF